MNKSPAKVVNQILREIGVIGNLATVKEAYSKQRIC
jgi:hypothetical protein